MVSEAISLSAIAVELEIGKIKSHARLVSLRRTARWHAERRRARGTEKRLVVSAVNDDDADRGICAVVVGVVLHRERVSLVLLVQVLPPANGSHEPAPGNGCAIFGHLDLPGSTGRECAEVARSAQRPDLLGPRSSPPRRPRALTAEVDASTPPFIAQRRSLRGLSWKPGSVLIC